MAAKAFERALALSEAGLFAIAPADLRYLLALAEHRIDPSGRGPRRALLKALRQAEKDGATPSADLADAWATLAFNAFVASDYRVSLEASTRAEPLVRAHLAGDNSLLTDLLIIKAISPVIGEDASKLKKKDLRAAYLILEEASALQDVNDLYVANSRFAIIEAWQVTIAAAATTNDIDMDFSALTTGEPRTPKTPRDDPSCSFEFEVNRVIPDFPNKDNRKGRIGAALIGYDWIGDRTENVRILAEVPTRSRFGEAAVEAVEKWRLETPLPSDKAHCGTKTITWFQYVY